MIKMIVTDLDGTLLRDDKSISDFTCDVLHRCRQRGIKVAYATGRGGSIAGLRAPENMFDGRITMNGAVVCAANEIIYSRHVSMDIARSFLLAAAGRGLKVTAECSGMHYSSFDVSAEWGGISNFEITDFSSHSIDAEKLYAVVRDSDDVDFLARHMPQELYMTVSRDNLAQVMHVDATKAKAVAQLAHHWSVRMDEVIAFGDDLNDMDMLSACGIGIAMGNGVEAVKAAAMEVCGTNQEDGMAWWIRANILKEAADEVHFPLRGI